MVSVSMANCVLWIRKTPRGASRRASVRPQRMLLSDRSAPHRGRSGPYPANAARNRRRHEYTLQRSSQRARRCGAAARRPPRSTARRAGIVRLFWLRSFKRFTAADRPAAGASEAPTLPRRTGHQCPQIAWMTNHRGTQLPLGSPGSRSRGES